MSTNTSSQINKKTGYFLVFASFLLFYIFRYFYQDQYPDWISYRIIYYDQGAGLRVDGLDFMYVILMNISTSLGLRYQYFRILVLILILWFFVKAIVKYKINEISFLVLLNLVFIFFQIREGLAVSIIYYVFSITNKKQIMLLNSVALFFHFTSISFVIISKQSKKLIRIIVLSTLVSLTVLFNFFYDIIYQYIALRYTHNLIDIEGSDIEYSQYFFITPLLYLILVMNVKVKSKDLPKYFFVLVLLICSFFPYVFSSFKIPNIVFNSFYRFVVIYLSFMVLKKKLTPTPLTYFVILLIVLKDLVSSQILYEV